MTFDLEKEKSKERVYLLVSHVKITRIHYFRKQLRSNLLTNCGTLIIQMGSFEVNTHTHQTYN